MMTLSQLESKVKEAARQYYAGTPIMTDAEFDVLALQLPEGHILRLTPGWGASELDTAAEGKVEVPHKFLVEGLPKRMYDGTPATVYEITHKLDGAACVLYYNANGRLENAVTRGDGSKGIRVDAELETFADEFHPNSKVRGEIVILIDDWLELLERDDCRQYKHPRNAVCGIMNSNSRHLDEYLTFIAYKWVDSPMETQTESNEEMEDAGFLTLRPVYEHDEDLYDNNSHLTGANVGHPWKEVLPDVFCVVDGSVWSHVESGIATAFKYENLEVEVEVTQVEWVPSDRGRIHPTVHFTPIELDGASITKASGKSGKYIVDNGIGPGAKIIVRRANNVIPDIVSTKTPAEVVLPEIEHYWEGANMRVQEGRSTYEGMQDACVQMILAKAKKGIAERGVKQFVILSDSLADCEMDESEKVGKTFRSIEQALAVAQMAKWSNYELLTFCKIDGVGKRASTAYLRGEATDRISQLIAGSALYSAMLAEYKPEMSFPQGFIQEDDDTGQHKVCITGSLDGFTKKSFAEKYDVRLVDVKDAEVVIASDLNSAKAKRAAKLSIPIMTQQEFMESL